MGTQRSSNSTGPSGTWCWRRKGQGRRQPAGHPAAAPVAKRFVYGLTRLSGRRRQRGCGVDEIRTRHDDAEAKTFTILVTLVS